MSAREKPPVFYRIDKKWVDEENRIFTEYPGMPETNLMGGLETWLELARFYVEDLKWLLSLDNYKFWSHMIHSEKAHELLVNFLKESPPRYMKNNLLVQEDIRNLFQEMEHLVFLIFLRLSTDEKTENFFIKNLGEIIYNNCLFSVPIILDICSIYSASNIELVKKMIRDVVEIAPYFLDDFQEIIPFFINVLKTVKEKFCEKSSNQIKKSSSDDKVQDVILYLYDSVATLQRFLEVYPNVCQFFSKNELISELITFYSNVLPEVETHFCDKSDKVMNNSFNICDMIENVRIDILKIVKSIFDFILSDENELEEREQILDEYLTLMIVVVTEPVFFSDYNLIYSVEFEIGCAVGNCQNVNMTKLNHILEKVESLSNSDENNSREKSQVSSALKLLVTEVKNIFPDLKDDYIERCLNYYDNSTERVISAILENSVPLELTHNEKQIEERSSEIKGKLNKKNYNFNEVLDDVEEKKAIKERVFLSQLSYVEEDTYEDEYDDTYDENIQVLEKDGESGGGEMFVVPRVLRALVEKEECDDDDDDDDGGEDEGEDGGGEEREDGRNYFVENPAVVRERLEQARGMRGKRDVRGRGRGQGQSNQVLRNRGFKEAHKSFIGNHNRKRGASKKLSRGMIPM